MAKIRADLKQKHLRREKNGFSRKSIQPLQHFQHQIGKGFGQGLVFDKSLGQHILKNPLVASAMVEKAGLKSTDTVLEVGPGTGNLTARLLPQVSKVIACEADPRMVAELHKRFGKTQGLEIRIGDILKAPLPAFNVCVSNLPYQISSKFFTRLLHHHPSFRCAVVMVQKEFADRLLAPPGHKLYCRLSANVQLLAKVDHLMTIGKNNFKPPPKVDSSVVRITPLPKPTGLSLSEWNGFLRIIFSKKNKTLESVFHQKPVVKYIKDNYQGEKLEFQQIKNVVRSILITENLLSKRARELCQEQLLSLLVALNRNNIRFNSLIA